MRALKTALAALAVAGFAAVAGQPSSQAQAQAPAATIPADMVNAAKAIQAGCVKRGEDSRVCACSVGIAYSKLEPKVFRMVPQIDPLLDQKNQAAATGQLLQLAMTNGLGIGDLQTAYDTIRANRAVVRQICKPLGPVAKAG
jgi:hypothetical protein